MWSSIEDRSCWASLGNHFGQAIRTPAEAWLAQVAALREPFATLGGAGWSHVPHPAVTTPEPPPHGHPSAASIGSGCGESGQPGFCWTCKSCQPCLPSSRESVHRPSPASTCCGCGQAALRTQSTSQSPDGAPGSPHCCPGRSVGSNKPSRSRSLTRCSGCQRCQRCGCSGKIL